VVKIILVTGAILMLWSSNATAQQRLAVGHCVADLRRLCPGVQPGNNRLRACMREHIRDVSFPCLVTLAKFAEVRRPLSEECNAHIRQQCANVERGEGRLGACLRSAVASLSDTCKDLLRERSAALAQRHTPTHNPEVHLCWCRAPESAMAYLV